ncbi:Uncharacterized protein APZ42_027317 [Daphnia magna]|uniref:Uncharacterized protein n=1 Tax=Daphnia magna TaxID=35525 RepID=A0A164RGC1_9CRUS|nr:Uncharacterized protein APZ42_027317 [Daphnia magna]
MGRWLVFPVPNCRSTQRHPWKVTDQPQQQQQPPRGKYATPTAGKCQFQKPH